MTHFSNIISEIVDENNLKYLDKKSPGLKESNNLPFMCNSRYASGQVFYSSILDAIIA